MIASFVYALWNRGLTVHTKLVDLAHPDELPAAEAALDDHPFEADTGRLRIRIDARRTIGPGRAAGNIAGAHYAIAAGMISQAGHVEFQPLPSLRRGPVTVTGWLVDTFDPLGLFRYRRYGIDGEMDVVLPRFASLRARPLTREVEAAVTAPRAGSGTEIFGVREYRPGDPLRRIHWRSTARRGELIVREFEPPGVQNLGIFLDPNPISIETADQIARLAASEAWDCLRAGGRVTLWAPGCEATRPHEEHNLLALLEWLARYPNPAAEDEPPPIVGDAIAVTSRSDARLLESIEDVRAHGGAVRAWVVGEAALESDIAAERAGLAWPL